MPTDWLGTGLFVGVLVGLTVQLGTLGGGQSVPSRGVRVVGGGGRGGAVRLAAVQHDVAGGGVAAVPGALVRGGDGVHAADEPDDVHDAADDPVLRARGAGQGHGALGLLLGAMSVLVAVTSPFGGRLSDAWGRRPSAQLGAVLMLAGTVALLAGLSPDVPPAYLAACLAVLGLGLGLGVGAASTAAVESAPRALAGSASGTSSMMRYVGSIVGAGILAGVLSSDAAGGDVTTFRLVMAAVVATAALSCVAAMFIHRFVGAEAVAVGREPAVEAV